MMVRSLPLSTTRITNLSDLVKSVSQAVAAKVCRSCQPLRTSASGTRYDPSSPRSLPLISPSLRSACLYVLSEVVRDGHELAAANGALESRTGYPAGADLGLQYDSSWFKAIGSGPFRQEPSRKKCPVIAGGRAAALPEGRHRGARKADI